MLLQGFYCYIFCKHNLGLFLVIETAAILIQKIFKTCAAAQGHIVTLQHLCYIVHIIPGLGNGQAHTLKDVGSYEHNAERTGVGKAKVFAVQHEGNIRVRHILCHNLIIVFILTKVFQRTTQAQVNDCIGVSADLNVGAVTGNLCFDQGALNQLQVDLDAGLGCKFVGDHILQDLELVHTGVHPNGDHVIFLFLLILIGEERLEERFYLIDDPFPCVHGGSFHFLIGRKQSDVVKVQSLTLIGVQFGTQTTDVVLHIGDSILIGQVNDIFGITLQVIGNVFKVSVFCALLTNDLLHTLSLVGQTIGQNHQILGQVGQLLCQIVVTIGVGLTTGDHNDGQVQFIQFIDGVAQHAEGVTHITNYVFHSDIVLTLGQEDVVSAVFIGKNHILPLSRIVETNSVQFLKGNSAVNIDSTGAEQTVQIALSVLETQVIQAVLGSFDLPGDPLTGFLPLAAATEVDLIIGIGERLSLGTAVVVVRPQSGTGLLIVGFCLEQFQNVLCVLVTLLLINRDIVLIGDHITLLLQGHSLQQQRATFETDRDLVGAFFQIKLEHTVDTCLVAEHLGSPTLELCSLRTQVVAVLVLLNSAVLEHTVQQATVSLNEGEFAVHVEAEGNLVVGIDHREILHFHIVETCLGHIYCESDQFTHCIDIQTLFRALLIFIQSGFGLDRTVFGLHNCKLGHINADLSLGKCSILVLLDVLGIVDQAILGVLIDPVAVARCIL